MEMGYHAFYYIGPCRLRTFQACLGMPNEAGVTGTIVRILRADPIS